VWGAGALLGREWTDVAEGQGAVMLAVVVCRVRGFENLAYVVTFALEFSWLGGDAEGRLSDDCGGLTLGTGEVEVACTRSRGGMGSTPEAVKMVLSRLRSQLWWVSAAQDTLLLVLVLVPLPLSRAKPSLIMKMLPPESCTSLQLLMLEPLRLYYVRM